MFSCDPNEFTPTLYDPLVILTLGSEVDEFANAIVVIYRAGCNSQILSISLSDSLWAPEAVHPVWPASSFKLGRTDI